MNMNRQSRREDVLFVIALLVPAIFAGARFGQTASDTEALIAARSPAVQVVLARQVADIRRG